MSRWPPAERQQSAARGPGDTAGQYGRAGAELLAGMVRLRAAPLGPAALRSQTTQCPPPVVILTLQGVRRWDWDLLRVGGPSAEGALKDTGPSASAPTRLLERYSWLLRLLRMEHCGFLRPWAGGGGAKRWLNGSMSHWPQAVPALACHLNDPSENARRLRRLMWVQGLLGVIKGI